LVRRALQKANATREVIGKRVASFVSLATALAFLEREMIYPRIVASRGVRSGEDYKGSSISGKAIGPHGRGEFYAGDGEGVECQLRVCPNLEEANLMDLVVRKCIAFALRVTSALALFNRGVVHS
jgi:hypothetical protein